MLRRRNDPSDTPSLHCLPAELIAKIFLDISGPRIPLSHISSYLRAVSLNTSALWSAIHVSGSNDIDKLAHQLKYSGNRSLHISLSFDATLKKVAAGFTILDIAQVIPMILPSSSRIQRLALTSGNWTDNQALQRLHLFDVALPNLETLEISMECEGPIPPTFLPGPTQNLAHVKIKLYDHYLQDPPQFLISETRLKSLHLILEDDIFLDVVPVLRVHAFSLVKLDLDFTLVSCPVHPPHSITPVVLESLETMRIRCGSAAPLAAISTPHLRHLELEFYEEDSLGMEQQESSEYDVALIFDFLRHHAEHLEFVSYHARNEPVEDEFTEYSMKPIYFPKVQTFRIRANVGQRTLLSECRFPILAELAITVLSDFPDSDISWDLVASCIDRNAHSLRSLAVTSDPYQRGCLVYDVPPTSSINLPLIESINLQGGGNLLASIVSAPRLKTLIMKDTCVCFCIL